MLVSSLCRLSGTALIDGLGNENTRDDNYITWVANGKPSWTLHAESIGPDPLADIGQRLVSEEPMYLILNFGMSGRFP